MTSKAFKNVQNLNGWTTVYEFGVVGDGVTNDTAAIQTALNSGEPLYFPPGTYLVGAELTAGAYAKIRGAGAGVTTIRKSSSGSGDILKIIGTSNKNDIEIEDISFDVNFKNAGIVVEYVTNFTVRRCRFNNMRVWGLSVGVQNGADTQIRNTGIVVEDCWFDNGTETYEHLLVFNSQDVRISRCRFTTGASAIGIGIYQVSERVNVDACFFGGGINQGAYYSVSCNENTFTNCDFVGCISAIKGANESDNGAFGATVSKNLTVNTCRFINNTTGLQIGAVQNACVSDCLFQLTKEQALFIDNGNAPVAATPSNIAISDCMFIDNNVNAVPGSAGAAIFCQDISAALYMSVTGCTFQDTRGTPKQLRCLGFDGAITVNNVIVSSSRLSAYSGAESISLTGGASIGSNVRVLDCMNVSAALPAGISRVDETNTQSVNFRPGSGNPIWTSGTGTPEGAVTAPIGSLFTRTDGGAVTTFYVKESGSGNTGWVAK